VALNARARHRSGTAVGAKGRRRVDEILDAATRILAERGYASLSLRAVAEGAGVALGHAQYYFPAKRDVVRGLLERYLARSVERLRERAGGAGAPEKRLRDAVHLLLADQLADPDCALFREIWALASRDAEVARALRAFYDEYRDRMRALLLAVSPGLGAARAARRAELLVALLEGLSVVRSEESPRARAALGGELAEAALALARAPA
jgi:AcrR family transcriptional regulator